MSKENWYEFALKSQLSIIFHKTGPYVRTVYVTFPHSHHKSKKTINGDCAAVRSWYNCLMDDFILSKKSLQKLLLLTVSVFVILLFIFIFAFVFVRIDLELDLEFIFVGCKIKIPTSPPAHTNTAGILGDYLIINCLKKS